MSTENQTPQESEAKDVETKTDEGTSFVPITTQEQFDKAIGGRIYEIKKQYSDYDELKAKASKFEELEEANKSDLQKLTERAEKAESELQTLKQEHQLTRWQREVANECELPLSTVELLRGSSKDEILQSARQIKESMHSKHAPVGISDTSKGKNAVSSSKETFKDWIEGNY